MAIVPPHPPMHTPSDPVCTRGSPDSKVIVFLDHCHNGKLYIYVCFTCFHGCAPHVCLVPAEARRGIGSPGAGVTGGCGPTCGCWEPNPVSPERHPVLTSNSSSTYIVRQGLPLEPRAADWASVAGQHVPVILSPPPKFQDNSDLYSSFWCSRRARAGTGWL